MKKIAQFIMLFLALLAAGGVGGEDQKPKITEESKNTLFEIFLDLPREFDKLQTHLSIRACKDFDWVAESQKAARPVVVASKILKVQTDNFTKEEGRGYAYILIENKVLYYGATDVMANLNPFGIRPPVERWHIEVDPQRPEGQMVLLIDAEELTKKLDGKEGKTFLFMVQPTVNIWLDSVRSANADSKFTDEERKEYLSDLRKKQYAIAQAFDPRIPWARVPFLDIVNKLGAEKYSEILRRELSLWNSEAWRLDGEKQEKYNKELSNLAKQPDAEEKMLCLMQEAPWYSVQFGASKLCETGNKKGFDKLVEMLAFESWAMSRNKKLVDDPNVTKLQVSDLRMPVGCALTILVPEIERFCDQKIANMDAFLKWYEENKMSLKWDENSKKFVLTKP